MNLLFICLSASVLIAFSVSALVGLLIRYSKPHWVLVTPAARSRLLVVGALLPLLVSGAVLTAALAPSFGWIADHCLAVAQGHSHQHICAEHHQQVKTSLPLAVLGLLLLGRFVHFVWLRVRSLHLAGRLASSLKKSSVEGPELGLRLLPDQHARAFVLGVFRPTLYLSQDLVTGSRRGHFEAVLAHERAHIRRQDSLSRFVAGIGLSLHLPGIAAALRRHLAEAQEMAADEEAAQAIGSHEHVAEALVALARSGLRSSEHSLAFASSPIRSRVESLLTDAQRHDFPGSATLLFVCCLFFVPIASRAGAVHHGVEILLNLFGS